MKSLNKIVSVVFFITPSILSMQEKPKQTQAELEQQEEQSESQKKLELQENRDFHIQNIFRDLLPDNIQKLILKYSDESNLSANDKLIIKMKAKLPNQIFLMIGRFVPDYKIVQRNIDKLLPAVILWDKTQKNIFFQINFTKRNLENAIDQDYSIETEKITILDNHKLFLKSKHCYLGKDTNSYAAFKLNNRQIRFVICRNKREQLESLSIEQLKYLIKLYDLSNCKAYEFPYSFSSDSNKDHHYNLNPTQYEIELYNTLPENIKKCLHHNYGNTLPYLMEYSILPNFRESII